LSVILPHRNCDAVPDLTMSSPSGRKCVDWGDVYEIDEESVNRGDLPTESINPNNLAVPGPCHAADTSTIDPRRRLLAPTRSSVFNGR
jgi:hypothetical protein